MEIENLTLTELCELKKITDELLLSYDKSISLLKSNSDKFFLLKENTIEKRKKCKELNEKIIFQIEKKLDII